MHIYDGFLSTPVCLATGAISLGAVSYSVYRLRDVLADRMVPMTGMVAALVFAGQMINFPAGPATKGHLIGGVLAARLLGPWGGCVALTLVLVVQRFLFGDGGLFTLGANILHMAVVGAIGGHAVHAMFARLVSDSTRGRIVGTVLAAWVTVMTAAVLCCVEFAATWVGNPDFDIGRFLALMIVFHAVIGVGEALISGGVIRFVAIRRPDLLYQADAAAPRPVRRAALHGLLVALAIVVFLAPLASEGPDGLESALSKTAPAGIEQPAASLLDGYESLLPIGGWQGWSVILSGLLGTLVVFAIAAGLSRVLDFRGGSTPKVPDD